MLTFSSYSILNLSPQGIFPILTDGKITIIGLEEIIKHLEKHTKLSKLNLPKKKHYSYWMSHCQTVFEPLVEKIIRTDHGTLSALFSQQLIAEFHEIEANIKVPFFFGSSLSWVGQRIILNYAIWRIIFFYFFY